MTIALWLGRMLREHGVSASCFFPSLALSGQWGPCLENAMHNLKQQLQSWASAGWG